MKGFHDSLFINMSTQCYVYGTDNEELCAMKYQFGKMIPHTRMMSKYSVPGTQYANKFFRVFRRHTDDEILKVGLLEQAMLCRKEDDDTSEIKKFYSDEIAAILIGKYKLIHGKPFIKMLPKDILEIFNHEIIKLYVENVCCTCGHDSHDDTCDIDSYYYELALSVGSAVDNFADACDTVNNVKINVFRYAHEITEAVMSENPSNRIFGLFYELLSTDSEVNNIHDFVRVCDFIMDLDLTWHDDNLYLRIYDKTYTDGKFENDNYNRKSFMIGKNDNFNNTLVPDFYPKSLYNVLHTNELGKAYYNSHHINYYRRELIDSDLHDGRSMSGTRSLHAHIIDDVPVCGYVEIKNRFIKYKIIDMIGSISMIESVIDQLQQLFGTPEFMTVSYPVFDEFIRRFPHVKFLKLSNSHIEPGSVYPYINAIIKNVPADKPSKWPVISGDVMFGWD